MFGRVHETRRSYSAVRYFSEAADPVISPDSAHGSSLFFQSERQQLDAVLQPLIEQKRRSDSKDVLSLLLGQTEGELKDEDIRNEMAAFVLAGHETTATALTCDCDLLAGEPNLQASLAEEAESVLGNRPAIPEDLPRLRRASHVFNETLRLYPPAPLFGRRVEEPVKLGITICRSAPPYFSAPM